MWWWIGGGVLGLIGGLYVWIRSLPTITIQARVYRASPEERALPTAEAERRYAAGIRTGTWEPGRIISQQIAWPWTVAAQAAAAARAGSEGSAAEKR